MTHTLLQKVGAEFIGTAGLLATVIGSGIMGETLAGGNVAIALLGNTIATGAILVVLIWVFGPISGAHFNPAVTIAFLVKGEISARDAAIFIVMQVLGAWVGMLVAHGMFDLALIGIDEGTDGYRTMVCGRRCDFWFGRHHIRLYPGAA